MKDEDPRQPDLQMEMHEDDKYQAKESEHKKSTKSSDQNKGKEANKSSSLQKQEVES
jgi:hypothetical protein